LLCFVTVARSGRRDELKLNILTYVGLSVATYVMRKANPVKNLEEPVNIKNSLMYNYNRIFLDGVFCNASTVLYV